MEARTFESTPRPIYAGAAPHLRELRTRTWRILPVPTGIKVLLGGAGAYYALLAVGTRLLS